MQMEQM